MEIEAIKLKYLGDGTFITIERLPDDSPEGTNHWYVQLPRVVIKKMGIEPEEGGVYTLAVAAEIAALFEASEAQVRAEVLKVIESKRRIAKRWGKLTEVERWQNHLIDEILEALRQGK